MTYHEKNIKADDIHPSLLEGLIPVPAPAFIGKDGEAKICKHEVIDGVEFAEDRLEYMPLIAKAVKIATENGWEYILGVFLREDGKIFVRGC